MYNGIVFLLGKYISLYISHMSLQDNLQRKKFKTYKFVHIHKSKHREKGFKTCFPWIIIASNSSKNIPYPTRIFTFPSF